ncbi:MAG: ABC transporter substrate-binding protein, partial [Alphaproteobacteria bacterium]
MTGALFVVLVSCCTALGDESPIFHALVMHGEATFPDGPQAPFDWVNPDAPQGGTLRLAETGTFDSMNPYIVFGLPARGLGLVFQSLLYRSPDEPFTLYP